MLAAKFLIDTQLYFCQTAHGEPHTGRARTPAAGVYDGTRTSCLASRLQPCHQLARRTAPLKRLARLSHSLFESGKHHQTCAERINTPFLLGLTQDAEARKLIAAQSTVHQETQSQVIVHMLRVQSGHRRCELIERI